MHIESTKKGYTPIPFKIIADIMNDVLKTKDLVTYFFATANQSDFPISVRTLSEQTGMSRVFLGESLTRLKSAGYLDWTSSTRRERVRIGDRMCSVNVERRCFSRTLNFCQGGVKYRKIKNKWRYLISNSADLCKITGIDSADGLRAIELAILIYLKVIRFESDLAHSCEETLVFNLSEMSKALNMSRSTLKKTIENLTNQRLVRIDHDSQITQLIDRRVNYVIEQRQQQEVERRKEKRKLNTDVFCFIDQMLLRKAIEAAGSKTYLAAVRSYLIDLVNNDFIDSERLKDLVQICDRAESRLKMHPEDVNADLIFEPDTIFPIWIGGKVG